MKDDNIKAAWVVVTAFFAGGLGYQVGPMVGLILLLVTLLGLCNLVLLASVDKKLDRLNELAEYGMEKVQE